jgi:hypothetical protein
MKSLDALSIQQCVFELRYSNAYLLWDRVGSIWTAMVATNPNLKPTLIQPTQQVFEADTLQIHVDSASMRVVSRDAEGIDIVTKNSSRLYKIVCENAKLDRFTRAGFRLVQSKVFDAPAKAMNFLTSLISDQQNISVLGEESRKVGFVRGSRFETDKAGLLTSLRVEDREFNFAVPWDNRPQFQAKLAWKEWLVVADADYYTIGAIERESFDVETWVRQASVTIGNHWSLM